MKWFALTRRIDNALMVAVDAIFTCMGSTQTSNSASAAPLNSEQIVDRMQLHGQIQMEMLGNYHALRHYVIEYRSFFKTLVAKMDVEVDYDAVSGKSFRIIAQSGSHTLCEKVLQRAVNSEKEASLNRSAAALTKANCTFHLAGSESLNGRPAYILDIEPIAPSKFLYRGRIWVDGIDFAVTRMEVQPCKNLSFWISKTVSHHTNTDIGGFWLPRQNRSEAKVRIGGTAVMTIDYGTYEIVPRRSRPMCLSCIEKQQLAWRLRLSTVNSSKYRSLEEKR
jgi:hypothetical protein